MVHSAAAGLRSPAVGFPAAARPPPSPVEAGCAAERGVGEQVVAKFLLRITSCAGNGGNHGPHRYGPRGCNAVQLRIVGTRPTMVAENGGASGANIKCF